MGNKESKPILKSTLKFFNTKLTDLNDKRLQLNRGKGLAKYLANPQKNTMDISPLETTLGVMSFSLYALRLSANIGLLIQLILKSSSKKINHNKHRDLYYRLLNDSLWCTVNLIQFFWLSFRNSTSAGLRGMQLEILAQLIDMLVMIIRYKQDQKEYEVKYNNASASERVRLEIEWQNKQLSVIRSLLTGLSVALVFALYSFSIASVPMSPIISSVIVISSLIRVLTDMDRDRKLLQHLKCNEMNPQKVLAEERRMTKARLHDLNQIILSSVLIPVGLFLLITTPIPIFAAVGLSMLLIHHVVNHLIDTTYAPDTMPSDSKTYNSL